MSEPTVFQKFKMGAMMGGTVGLCLGLIFGTINVVRFGGGTKGSLNTIASYMGSSAATFGFFMAVGSVIRTEEHPLSIKEQARWASTPVTMAAGFRQPKYSA